MMSAERDRRLRRGQAADHPMRTTTAHEPHPGDLRARLDRLVDDPPMFPDRLAVVRQRASTIRRRRMTALVSSVAALAAAVVLAMVGLPGSGSPGTSIGAARARLVHRGLLTVCTHVPYPPLEYQQPGGGY